MICCRMIDNALFRKCLAAIPEELKAAFELSYGIAERISEVFKKNFTQNSSPKKFTKHTLPIIETSSMCFSC